jgi:hypothetical protein
VQNNSQIGLKKNNYHCTEYEPEAFFPKFTLAAVIFSNPGGNPNKAVIKPESKDIIKFIGSVSIHKKATNFKNNYSLILNRIYVIALLTSKYCFS